MNLQDIEDIYRLSPLQEGMLYHALRTPGGGAYLEYLSFELHERLDVEALRRAWHLMVDRHATLRTSFHWQARPVQVVHRRAALPFEHADWRGLPVAEQQARLAAFHDAERTREFDLAQAPLTRVTILQFADDVYQLVWSFHHIILDGWSMAVLLREVFAAYTAFRRGGEPHLDPPPAYRSFLAWLQQQDPARAESFWRRELDGITGPTMWSALSGAARAAASADDYAIAKARLSRASTAALHGFAQRHGLTLNTVVQGAWAVLLARYSGENDVVFGTITSGRSPSLPGSEALVGFCVNTIPARVRIDDDAALPAFLQELQRRQVEAREHEYASLIQIQDWSGLPRGTPLFESIQMLENLPIDEALASELGYVDWSKVEFFVKVSDPVNLMVVPSPELLLSVMYYPAYLDAAAVERMLGHVRVLLEGMATSSRQCTVGELPLLTDGERHQLLCTWNDTAADYPRDRCAHQLFETAAARAPDAVAVSAPDGELTYGELDRRANRLAHFLGKLGVGPEVRVGIYVERSLDMVVAVLGVLKAGGTYVPLDPAYPTERLSFMLADSEAPVLLTQEALDGRLAGHHARVVRLDADRDAIAREPDTAPPSLVRPEHLAYVIYTSGSTGRPKGVQVLHRGIVNFVTSLWARTGLGSDDTVLAVASLSFDMSTLDLFATLGSGARLVIASRDTASDGAELARRLRETGATAMQATPATWGMLLEAGWPGDPRMKILCGGEALPRELANRLLDHGRVVWNLYGPTETTVYSTVSRVERGELSSIVPISDPIANTQIYILDRRLRPVPVGIAGELCIGGDGVARGYWNRPELTADRFRRDPFRADPDARLYRTGDTARLLADGTIEFLGRADHQIKIRGFRVELGEIEAVLAEHPAVQQVVVAAREEREGDRRLVAYVVPRPGGAANHDRDAWEREWITQWQAVYDASYGDSSPALDRSFDTSGWVSSYTGQPIAAEDMRAWVDNAVRRVRSLAPERILEIGCGTGLLLHRLAPEARLYRGSDVSRVAIARLGAEAAARGLRQVQLDERTADDFTGIEPGSFDTVILNSVVQYFPSAGYLERVIAGAVRATAAGGRVYLGDVRSLPLLDAFHLSVEMRQAPSVSPVAQLRDAARRRAEKEHELVIAPSLFTALQRRIPRIRAVQALLQRGRQRNEMTCFRYDVILHVGSAGAESPADPVRWIDGPQSHPDLADLEAVLREAAGKPVGVRDLPNARIQRELHALALVEAASPPATVGALWDAIESPAVAAFDPADLYALGDRLGYTTHVGYAASGDIGRCDVVFRRGSAAPIALGVPADEASARSAATNDPMRAKGLRALATEWRSFLKERLPEYMVPSAFVTLDALPLTPNGKIARGALPAPDRDGAALDREFVAPRNPTEFQLAHIWEEVLDVHPIGVRDDFFALGGHSIAAVRLMARVHKQLGQELPLSALLSGPTIEQMAQVLQRTMTAGGRSPIIALQSAGRHPPLFCVHPAGGNILCYADLARHLGADRPVYGLEAPGLVEGEVPYETIEDFAQAYLRALRQVQPDGPYFLGGWSFGGVVAFEIAQQLVRDRSEIALLAVFDTALPSPGASGPVHDIELSARRLVRFVRFLEVFHGRPLQVSYRALRQLAVEDQMELVIRNAIAAGCMPADVGPAQLRRIAQVSLANMQALQSYRPVIYPGPITVFRAVDGLPEYMREIGLDYDDPTLGWAGLSSEPVHVIDVPGDHMSMFSRPHVSVLAERLRAELDARCHG